jgi:hypothetical protein
MEGMHVYIDYKTVGGIEYGTVMKSVRTGGKVGKGDQVYLGGEHLANLEAKENIVRYIPASI